MGAIYIHCPLCPLPLQCPEQLCVHLEVSHGLPSTVLERKFDDADQFNFWLTAIECCRSEGGYVGSEEGPSHEQDEYYLLCHRREAPCAKRRRLEKSWTDSDEVFVCCPAFVHVTEHDDGSVQVRYCLHHCGHSTTTQQTTPQRLRRRNVLKRRSDSMDDEDSNCSTSTSSASSPRSDGDESLGATDVDEVSILNDHISERLDRTADRLKAITQFLAELSVDIVKYEQLRVGIAV